MNSDEQMVGGNAVRFYSSFEPVTGLYREMATALAARRWKLEFVLSAAEYAKGRNSLEEVVEETGARVVRIPSFIRYRRTTMGRLVVSATYAVGALAWALSRRSGAVNIYLTQPPLYLAVIPLVKFFRKGRYICIINDLYPHVAAAGGYAREGSWGFRIMRRMVVRALQRTDVVIAIGRCMRDRLIREGVDEDHIRIIENWTDATKVYPVPRSENPLAEKLGIKNEFVVLYSGNMGIAHEFDTLMDVMEELRGQPIRCVMIGEGAKKKTVEARVRERGLTNVTLEPYLAEDWLKYSQSLGDVHFISLKPEFTGLIVPSKTYSAMAAGRPVIYEGSADGEIARMIAKHQLGSVIAPGDRRSLKQAILGLAKQRSLGEEMGRRARVLAESGYGKASALAKYVDAIKGSPFNT